MTLLRHFSQPQLGEMSAAFMFNAAEHPHLVIKINAIESLIESIVEMIADCKPMADRLSNDFPPVAKRIAGKDFKVKFETV